MRAFLKSPLGLFHLGPKITTVGRENCDIILQSSSVDSQHAVIEYRGDLDDTFTLQDLSTTHGTYVNECRIGNAVVRIFHGDHIRFGNSSTVYELFVQNEPSVTLQRQTAWQNPTVSVITDPYAPQPIYPSSLPQLNSFVGVTTQTYTPVCAPLPRPPPSVRTRPLSAGARNRHIVERAPPTNLGPVPQARPASNGWAHGGTTLLRSSSTTDLRALQEQEDQKVSWLTEEVQRLSTYERECQLKDAQIEKMRHELQMIYGRQQQQQQHRSPCDNDCYMDGNTDVAQRLAFLEREVMAKRAEVSELRMKLEQQQNHGHRKHSLTMGGPLDQLQSELQRVNALLVQTEQSVVNKDKELGELRHELEELKGSLHDKESLLSKATDDLTMRDKQIDALQEKLKDAEDETSSEKNAIVSLKTLVDELHSRISADKETIESLQRQLDVRAKTYQDSEFAYTKLQEELDLVANKAETFRRQVKQAACFASASLISSSCDDDDDLVEVIKTNVSERAKYKSKYQDTKAKLKEAEKLDENIQLVKSRIEDSVSSLISNGYFCRELKLEVAALRSTLHDDDDMCGLKPVLVSWMESQLEWQNQIEAALEDCGIDLSASRDGPAHHIRNIHRQLSAVRLELIHVQNELDEAGRRSANERAESLDAQKRVMEDEIAARIERLVSEYEEKLQKAALDHQTAETVKIEELETAKQRQIAHLENEIVLLKQSLELKEKAEQDLRHELTDVSNRTGEFRQQEADLKHKICDLETELGAAGARLGAQLAEQTQRHTEEIAGYKQQIQQHALTICALEERLDAVTSKAKEYQAETTELKTTISQLSAKLAQPSSPVRPKVIVQPAQSPLDAAAMSQLQRENIDIKRQLHEQADVIVSLRRDLAGARAKLSDITGEMSESQKQELEHYRATAKQQDAELVELRQQLAKLSEIVDRQTDDMKQLNAEANKHKLALTKYKNKLNEKEARLKETEEGLVKIKQESTTKLAAVEDEGRISSELAMHGARCRGERHEQVIARQREALIELRAKIKLFEMSNSAPIPHDEALYELAIVRQQLDDLQAQVSGQSSSFQNYQQLGIEISQPLPTSELAEAFEQCENLYLSLVRGIGCILDPEDLNVMKSMAHAPRDERLRILVEREHQCERLVAILRTWKERIERKDELLQGYERDLAKLRQVEDLTQLTCGEKENLIEELRKKSEEVEYLRECLSKTRGHFEQEKRLNAAIKQKKTFHLENEHVQKNGFPKHRCVSDDQKSSGKKKSENDLVRRKNYEIKALQDELRARHAASAHHRPHSIDSGRGISSD